MKQQHARANTKWTLFFQAVIDICELPILNNSDSKTAQYTATIFRAMPLYESVHVRDLKTFRIVSGDSEIHRLLLENATFCMTRTLNTTGILRNVSAHCELSYCEKKLLNSLANGTHVVLVASDHCKNTLPISSLFGYFKKRRLPIRFNPRNFHST